MTVDDSYDEVSYVVSLRGNSREDFALVNDGREPPQVAIGHNDPRNLTGIKPLSDVEDIFFIPGEFRNGDESVPGMSATYFGMGRPLTLAFSRSESAAEEAEKAVQAVEDAFPEQVNLHMVGGEPSEETVELYREIGLAPCSEPNFCAYEDISGPRETTIREAIEGVSDRLSELEKEVLFS